MVVLKFGEPAEVSQREGDDGGERCQLEDRKRHGIFGKLSVGLVLIVSSV